MTDTEQPTPPPAIPEPRSNGRLTKAAIALETRGVGVDPEGEGVPHAGLRLAALLAALVALGIWNPWMLVVITAIVVMITLHEFGHYLMAKRAGMKVTEFFLFFGPKIWSIKRGETEYGIKCIPAGAYVKIIGMTNLEEVAPEDEARSYRQKTFAQRVKVAVAGSTMHFLLALVLIFVALSVTGQVGGSVDPRVQAKSWTIGSVTPGTGAEAAGLREGDKILSVGGWSVSTFDDLRSVAAPRKGETVPVVYERDGARRTAQVALKPFYSWHVARVVPGSGVAASALEPFDQVLAVDGTPLRTERNPTALLRRLQGKTVDVTYERGAPDADRTARVEIDSLILEGSEGYIGIGVDYPAAQRVGLLEGLAKAPVDFGRITSLSVTQFGRFFTPSGISDFASQVGSARTDAKGTEPTSNASAAKLRSGGSGSAVGENRLLSIYGLVRVGSDVGSADPGALINLFALINIFIGMFNLVPLLPFDGGHVLIAVYEKVQEKRLRQRRYFTDVARLLPLTYVVVFGLGLLFVSSLYLDIANPLSS
ncbi:site-2 protease family protein [Aquihabitans sp. G128]|uniref:site-2 protease family protein n=1 Tax=Aquihabitans sp. G128 TaxID=2849779 RepID=UPI001C244AF4|nr:site-2 protease family protein [Aquihabitans sp. G128]QXC62604.1 site-2 protease family protein [Aquihabitans sp. G128]